MIVGLLYFLCSSCDESTKTANTPVFFDTTFVLYNHTFKLDFVEISDRDWMMTLLRDNEKVLIDTLPLENIVNIDVSDVNMDGNKDILFQSGRLIPVSTLYLFNASESSFQKVEGFDEYHGIVRIDGNDKCFFSYDKIGCRNLNWMSTLFYVKEFKVIPIARMYGNACDSLPDETLKEIRIFKVSENGLSGEIFVEKIPYSETIKENEQKFDFIEQYWNQNLSLFFTVENEK